MMPSFLARLAPRDRKALLLGALFAVPMLGYKAVVRPYLGALEDVRVAVAQERSLLQREINLLARAPLLPQETIYARDAERSVRSRVFTGDDVIEATSALSSYVGGALRTAVAAVQQVESREAGEVVAGLREISIDIRAEGSLASVLRALRALESGPRLVRVTRVNVERSLATPAPGSAESLVISATVRGYAVVGEAQ